MKIQQARMIYVISNPETNRVKVGITNNITARLSSIESSCGCKLDLIHYTAPLENALEYEARCHEALLPYKYFGEWYKVTIDEAVHVVKDITQDAMIDDFVKQYIELHKSINEIAQEFDVSRQGVVKRLLQYGVYINKNKDMYPNLTPKKHKRFKQRVMNRQTIKPKEDKPTSQIEFCINSYTRIAPNTYKHKLTQEIVMAKWFDGKIQIYIESN